MTGLFDQLQVLLAGLLDVLDILMLPAGGLSDMAQEPVKVLIWFGLVLLFVPVTWRLLVRLARPQRRKVRQVVAYVPPPKPPHIAPAPQTPRPALPAPVAASAKTRASGACGRRRCAATVEIDGGALEAKTIRKRKTHSLLQTDRGYVVADSSGRAVTGHQHDRDVALAALDSVAPVQRKKKAPTRKPAAATTTNNMTQAFGNDPNTVYDFRYRVVELDDLIASNTDMGGINPAYDQTLQPRQRDRAASRRQIEQLAKNLVPEAFLWDFKQLDKGAPIIGTDHMVESGNGRTLALRRARAENMTGWEQYQERLLQQAKELGIAGEIEGKAAPVLVRERVTDVDRAAFAREANAPPVLQMSPLEQARVDAGRIRDDQVVQLTVKDDQSIDKALRAAANRPFVESFLGTLSDNERAVLLRKDGTLNQMGIWRAKGALFVRSFPGEAGERLSDTFLEALDSDIKNFETAISTALPRLSRVEGLIASGQRESDLRITDDLSKSLDMLARLRENDMQPRLYVEQASMFERELTPFQERLLIHFDAIGRRPKTIREFLYAYADLVEEQPQAGQQDLFGDRATMTKDEIFDRITQRQAERQAA